MRVPLLLATLLLAGCASAPVPAPRTAAPPERTAAAYPVRPALDKRGLEAVMGKDIGTLKRLFGEPRIDVVEVYGGDTQALSQGDLRSHAQRPGAAAMAKEKMLRFVTVGREMGLTQRDLDDLIDQRRAEADDFYDVITPPSVDDAAVALRAAGGWSAVGSAPKR